MIEETFKKIIFSDSLNKDERAPRTRFRWLFDNHYDAVYNFFFHRGFSTEDCRDLAQETFLAVFTSWSKFRGEASIETWLFSIATNVWRQTLRDRNRAKRRAEEISLEMLFDDQPEAAPAIPLTEAGADVEGRVLARERIRMVRDALEDLPESMRLCTFLRLDQGLKYREIADVMQIPIEKVKSQLFQARTKLKKRLAKHFSEIDL